MKHTHQVSQLIPCPGCSRHVRQSESACPFCNRALSLGHVPAAELPRTRLGRAATFAFGATLVSATALAGCGGESQTGKEGGGGTSVGGSSAGSNSGGTSVGGTSTGGSTSTAGETTGGGPVYGAPPGGTGNDNVAGQPTTGGTGTAGPVYGAPPGGFGNESGGTPGVPVYGAAPAD